MPFLNMSLLEWTRKNGHFPTESTLYSLNVFVAVFDL